MSSPANVVQPEQTDVTRAWLWLGLAGSTLVALLAVLADEPLVAILALMALPLGLLAIAYPRLPTAVVIFVLYSNAAVVAVRFHGVPAIAALAVPAMLLLPLAYYLIIRREKIIFTATFPWVVAFIVIQALGLLVAKRPEEAMSNLITSLVEGLALYFLMTNVVRDRRSATQAIWALLLAGIFMGGLSAYQQATRTFHNQYGGFAQVPGSGFRVTSNGVTVRQARLCGPVGEQNRYAQIMLMLVPLGMFQFWSESRISRKLLAAGATALSAAGCALAFSRGAAVGFVLLIVLMAVMRQMRWSQLIGLVLAAILVMAAIPQYGARLVSLQSLANYATTGRTAGELDGAVRGRATAMLAAVRVAADYPLLGVGPGMFNYYSKEYGNEGGLRALEGNREAHCLYLELAAEHGIPGLLCFAAIVGVSLLNLSRARRLLEGRDRQLQYMAIGFTLALAAYLTTGIFLHLSYARYFWLMLALADAVSYTGLREAERLDADAAPIHPVAE